MLESALKLRTTDFRRKLDARNVTTTKDNQKIGLTSLDVLDLPLEGGEITLITTGVTSSQ